MELRDLLVCRNCGGELLHEDVGSTCLHCAITYPLQDGVYVCVEDDGHTGAFSDQWDKHRVTQVDSRGYRCGYSGFSNSADTFWKKTQLQPGELHGKLVLDAGCGPGRFSEIIAPLAGGLICVDLSTAVFRAAELLRGCDNCLFIKGDLSHLPLRSRVLDVVFSIGVLHHTVQPTLSVAELARVLAPGGILAGWVYAKGKSYGTPQRDAVRAFTTDPANAEWVWKFARLAPLLRDLRGPGWDMLQEVLGISSSCNDLECVLDTFDWLTPVHQYQYTQNEFATLLAQAGFAGIQMGDIPVSFRAYRG